MSNTKKTIGRLIGGFVFVIGATLTVKHLGVDASYSIIILVVGLFIVNHFKR